MSEDKTDDLKDDKKVKFDYIKSNFFRVIHADGVWGGIGPTLNDIKMVFFNERPAIPQQVTHEIKDGVLGEEIKEERVSRNSIIREVEVNVIMNIHVARAVKKWLEDKINAIEHLEREIQEKEQEKPKKKSKKNKSMDI